MLFPFLNFVVSNGEHAAPTTNSLPFAEGAFFHITPVDVQLTRQYTTIMTDREELYFAYLIIFKTGFLSVAKPFKRSDNQCHCFVLSSLNLARPPFGDQMPVVLYQFNFLSVRERAPRNG